MSRSSRKARHSHKKASSRKVNTGAGGRSKVKLKPIYTRSTSPETSGPDTSYNAFSHGLRKAATPRPHHQSTSANDISLEGLRRHGKKLYNYIRGVPGSPDVPSQAGINGSGKAPLSASDDSEDLYNINQIVSDSLLNIRSFVDGDIREARQYLPVEDYGPEAVPLEQYEGTPSNSPEPTSHKRDKVNRIKNGREDSRKSNGILTGEEMKVLSSRRTKRNKNKCSSETTPSCLNLKLKEISKSAKASGTKTVKEKSKSLKAERAGTRMDAGERVYGRGGAPPRRQRGVLMLGDQGPVGVPIAQLTHPRSLAIRAPSSIDGLRDYYSQLSVPYQMFSILLVFVSIASAWQVWRNLKGSIDFRKAERARQRASKTGGLSSATSESDMDYIKRKTMLPRHAEYLAARRFPTASVSRDGIESEGSSSETKRIWDDRWSLYSTDAADKQRITSTVKRGGSNKKPTKETESGGSGKASSRSQTTGDTTSSSARSTTKNIRESTTKSTSTLGATASQHTEFKGRKPNKWNQKWWNTLMDIVDSEWCPRANIAACLAADKARDVEYRLRLVSETRHRFNELISFLNEQQSELAREIGANNMDQMEGEHCSWWQIWCSVPWGDIWRKIYMEMDKFMTKIPRAAPRNPGDIAASGQNSTSGSIKAWVGSFLPVSISFKDLFLEILRQILKVLSWLPWALEKYFNKYPAFSKEVVEEASQNIFEYFPSATILSDEARWFFLFPYELTRLNSDKGTPLHQKAYSIYAFLWFYVISLTLAIGALKFFYMMLLLAVRIIFKHHIERSKTYRKHYEMDTKEAKHSGSKLARTLFATEAWTRKIIYRRVQWLQERPGAIIPYIRIYDWVSENLGYITYFFDHWWVEILDLIKRFAWFVRERSNWEVSKWKPGRAVIEVLKIVVLPPFQAVCGFVVALGAFSVLMFFLAFAIIYNVMGYFWNKIKPICRAVRRVYRWFRPQKKPRRPAKQSVGRRPSQRKPRTPGRYTFGDEPPEAPESLFEGASSRRGTRPTPRVNNREELTDPSTWQTPALTNRNTPPEGRLVLKDAYRTPPHKDMFVVSHDVYEKVKGSHKKLRRAAEVMMRNEKRIATLHSLKAILSKEQRNLLNANPDDEEVKASVEDNNRVLDIINQHIKERRNNRDKKLHGLESATKSHDTVWNDTLHALTVGGVIASHGTDFDKMSPKTTKENVEEALWRIGIDPETGGTIHNSSGSDSSGPDDDNLDRSSDYDDNGDGPGGSMFRGNRGGSTGDDRGRSREARDDTQRGDNTGQEEDRDRTPTAKRVKRDHGRENAPPQDQGDDKSDDDDDESRPDTGSSAIRVGDNTRKNIPTETGIERSRESQDDESEEEEIEDQAPTGILANLTQSITGIFGASSATENPEKQPIRPEDHESQDKAVQGEGSGKEKFLPGSFSDAYQKAGIKSPGHTDNISVFTAGTPGSNHDWDRDAAKKSENLKAGGNLQSTPKTNAEKPVTSRPDILSASSVDSLNTQSSQASSSSSAIISPAETEEYESFDPSDMTLNEQISNFAKDYFTSSKRELAREAPVSSLNDSEFEDERYTRSGSGSYTPSSSRFRASAATEASQERTFDNNKPGLGGRNVGQSTASPSESSSSHSSLGRSSSSSFLSALSSGDFRLARSRGRLQQNRTQELSSAAKRRADLDEMVSGPIPETPPPGVVYPPKPQRPTKADRVRLADDFGHSWNGISAMQEEAEMERRNKDWEDECRKLLKGYVEKQYEETQSPRLSENWRSQSGTIGSPLREARSPGESSRTSQPPSTQQAVQTPPTRQTTQTPPSGRPAGGSIHERLKQFENKK